MEQVEQNQDEARGCQEEGSGAKGVFQYVLDVPLIRCISDTGMRCEGRLQMVQ